MKLSDQFASFLLSFVFLIAFFDCTAQVRLPALVSDGMVLQRNTRVNVWGWATPGEKVTLQFNGKKYSAITGKDTKWNIILPNLKAGGPYTMDITATNHITLSNILVGDVWFCAGQSNMVIPMERVKEKYPEEISSANYPQIRNFYIPPVSDVAKPHDDLPPGKWKEATPKNVLEFGAASWFFALQLHEKYHIPIGIINSSVGGTPIQAWVSEAGLKIIPQYAGRITQLKDTAYLNRIKKPAYTKPVKQVDKGLTGPKTWYDTTYIPVDWHQFWLPGYWADQGIKGLNGVVWFRKEVNVPANMTGKPAKLFLGRIVDADQVYVNGILSGNTTYQYPPRRYELPANLLKPGKNIIVVRVINTAGKGGFVPQKPYYLSSNGQNIDLRGDWQYKVGQVYEPADVAPGNNFSAQNEPAGLYNTMVAPAINYGIKGFVWYQGEANTNKPAEYKQLLPALIADWRTQWHNNDMPFIYVQLPNFMDVQYSPSESQWAELRDAQLKTLVVPNTAMVVTIDAGEWNDIHPLNKKVVGQRLALAAENLAYGDKGLIASGPTYRSAKTDGNRVIITFDHIGTGMIAKGGGELEQFAIAGADKKFVWAKAIIEGDKVIVSSNEIPNPMYVRYAWADNPENPNLYNKEGLPASPFRTDGTN